MTTMTIEYGNQGGLPEMQKPIELATHCKNISSLHENNI